MFYLVIYVIILFVALCNFFSYTKNEIQLSNVLFYTVIFILFIIGAFRFETGGDWPGYKDMYDERRGEPLFLGIIYLSHFIGHYQYIFFFTELIRYLILIYIINTYFEYEPRYKSLFILLYFSMYFFYYDMVIVRQTTAAIIFAFGIVKNKEETIKVYIFYSIIAALFHYSALILLFLYKPLYRSNNKKFTWLIYLFIILYFLEIDLLASLLSFILKFIPKIGIFQRLYAYTVQADLATKRNLTGQSFVYLTIFILISYLKIIKKIKINSTIYNGICLYMTFYIGMPSFSVISTRLSTFYSIFVIFGIVEIMKQYKKTIIVPLCLTFLCFCFNKNIFFEAPDKLAYTPYQFYFTYSIVNKKSDGLERLNKTNEIMKKMEKIKE